MVGLVETLDAAKAHEHYQAPLGKHQGRGVASGYWFNIGGETCANLNLTEDGTVNLMAGTPDIGGSRASLAMMAAELEVDQHRLHTVLERHVRDCRVTTKLAIVAIWRSWNCPAEARSGKCS